MSKPTVYVVDDQPAVCHGLREMLGVLGYEVETFGSADQFLNSLDPLDPAVSWPMCGCPVRTEWS